MTNEKVEARLKYTQQQLADVNYALVSLEEQRAVKQLRMDVWHRNTLARLTRAKARLTSKAHKLAAAKRAKQRNKPRTPATDTLVSTCDLDGPVLVNLK